MKARQAMVVFLWHARINRWAHIRVEAGVIHEKKGVEQLYAQHVVALAVAKCNVSLHTTRRVEA